VRDDGADEEEFHRCQRGTRAAAAVRTETPKTKSKPADQFARMPLWWAEQAARATREPGIFVCVWLLHLAWKTRSSTFPLPNGQLRSRGISRKAKYRVLRELEAAGLIRVVRAPRKTPVVTLLYC
jgi:hypothetical protein